MELISTCCSATIFENNDLCSDCKEHTSAVDISSESEDEYLFEINKWIKQ